MKHEPSQRFLDYLKYARTRLLGSSPFLGTLVIHCKVTERKGTGGDNETAYTNGRDVVFYDTLVEKVSREDFTGILLHEILHVAWLHVQRAKSEHLKPRVWNWACFKADAPVLTSEGYKPIADVTPSMSVLDKEGRFSPVVKLIEKQWDGDMVTLKANAMLPVEATGNHRIWVRTRKKGYPVKLSEPCWKNARDVTTLDYVMVPRPEATELPLGLTAFTSGENAEKLSSLPLDEETAWCLGRYAADGSHNDGGVAFSIGKAKRDDALRLSRWVQSLGFAGNIVEQPSVYKVEFNSTTFARWAEATFGRGAAAKQVPAVMHTQAPIIKRAFIEGYLAGDGCPQPKHKVNVAASASVDLVRGLQALALSVGLQAATNTVVRTRKLPGAAEATEQTIHYLHVREVNATTRNLTGKTITSNSARIKYLEDGAWTPITETSSEAYSGSVYTLSTSGSYTVGNIAVKNCDFVINLVIRDAAEELGRALSNVKPFTLPDWVLFDEQYRGMSSDAVYQKLLQELPPELANMSLDGTPGQGDCAGGDDRSFTADDLKDFLPGYNPDKNLDGDIQPDSAGAPGGGQGDEDGVGKPLSYDELQKAGAEWKQVVSQAAQSAKMQGKMPAYLEKFVEGLLYPKVDWRRLLKDFIQAFPVDYSFMNPDRRFADFEFIIPSLHGEQVELTVAVDTSGSFSQEQLREALTEVYDMVASFDYITLTVLSCDAAVQSVETIHSRYEIDKIKLRGGGGTDFKPVFEWVKENQPGCKAVVYFTDCYGTFPDEEPPFKTLWIVSSEYNLDDIPFGHAIRY